MEVKSLSVPAQFFGNCPKCGQYRLKEQTFRSHVDGPQKRKILKKLDKEIKKGKNKGFILDFKKHCKVCEPNNVQEITLVCIENFEVFKREKS